MNETNAHLIADALEMAKERDSLKGACEGYRENEKTAIARAVRAEEKLYKLVEALKFVYRDLNTSLDYEASLIVKDALVSVGVRTIDMR